MDPPEARSWPPPLNTSANSRTLTFKVYEDNTYFAFLDNNPLNKGHILLIPKDHYRWVYDVPNVGEYWATANKVALMVQPKLKAEYISFITAGMEVPHAHIHIVPRYLNDHMSGMFDPYRLHSSEKEKEEVYNQIIK